MMASNKNKLYLLKDTVVANENVALTRNETIDNQMNGILNSKFFGVGAAETGDTYGLKNNIYLVKIFTTRALMARVFHCVFSHTIVSYAEETVQLNLVN